MNEIELRKLVGREGDGFGLAGFNFYFLRELNCLDATSQCGFDLPVRSVMHLRVDGEMCSIERRQIEMSDYLRIAQRDRSTGGEVNVAKDPKVLVGRHRIPIDKSPTEIIDLLRKHFDGERVQ